MMFIENSFSISLVVKLIVCNRIKIFPITVFHFIDFSV